MGQKGDIRVPNLRLLVNPDGTYDLILEYSSGDVEFAEEFSVKKSLQKNSKRLLNAIRSCAEKGKIRNVKILVSGALVATVAFSSFMSAFAASDRYTMGYLYTGTDHQQVEYVENTGEALDVVSPSYFDIREDGSLKLNHLSSYFIKTMHDKGLKVVPFLSNHWNRQAGIRALENRESLAQQIAQYVEEYNLDGINLDIENVTHNERKSYTDKIRLLREKIMAEKEVSVAVAANPKNWQVGWHGSYDYAALGKYADHLMIMAYDEHYEGGEPGPVSSYEFVESSIQYALQHVSSDQVVLGIPLYGRVWSMDNESVVGKGVSSKVIQEILKDCPSTIVYDPETRSVKAEFTVPASGTDYVVGVNTVLQPGKYQVWFEDSQSYEAKLGLVEKYDLKGAGAWSLGQEDPSIWENYPDWVNGEEESTPSLPENPQTPPSGENFVHTVKKGDTLWKLAQQYLGDGSRYPEIMEMNALSGTTLYPGMQLKIPGKTQTPSTPEATYRSHTVKKGDTLWKIAKTYFGDGNRYPEIVKLNNLSGNTIHPGQVLKIPN